MRRSSRGPVEWAPPDAAGRLAVTPAEPPAGEARRDIVRPGGRSRLLAVAATLAGAATGLPFLLFERQDAFVRFHAAQAVAVPGLIWLAGLVCWAFGVARALAVDGGGALWVRAGQGLWALAIVLTCWCAGLAAAGRAKALPGCGRVVGWLSRIGAPRAAEVPSGA